MTSPHQEKTRRDLPELRLKTFIEDEKSFHEEPCEEAPSAHVRGALVSTVTDRQTAAYETAVFLVEGVVHYNRMLYRRRFFSLEASRAHHDAVCVFIQAHAHLGPARLSLLLKSTHVPYDTIPPLLLEEEVFSN